MLALEIILLFKLLQQHYSNLSQRISYIAWKANYTKGKNSISEMVLSCLNKLEKEIYLRKAMTFCGRRFQNLHA